MKNFFRLFFHSIFSLLNLLVTGGNYGTYIPDQKGRDAYGKRQDQRRKDFSQFGGRSCKICDIRIPANKYYCAPCFHKYVKK